MTRHDPELAKAFEANRAAIDAVNGQAKTRAHIDGTAYTHQRILRRETIETALRYRAARVLGNRDMMRAHGMALRSLNRLRREMRDAYPGAKPFHLGAAA